MELDTSALNSRRPTGVPLCLSKAQKDALGSASRSANTSSSPSHRVSRHVSAAYAQTNAELPPDVDRALQMFRTYPVMRVAGTAFENYLKKSDGRLNGSLSGANLSVESATVGSAAHKSATSQVLQDAVEVSVSHLEADRGASLRRNSGDGMVRLASAVKRAAMWQTAIVAALAGYNMSDEYREMRLRTALERHMLPVLVKRREETGSVMDTEKVKLMTKRTQAQKQEAGSAPQGAYLKEHYPLFASFGNSQLLQLLADKTERVRHVAGETVAEADQPSQHRLYFLVSGKCEVRVGTRDETGTITVAKSLIESGAAFGGIFGTTALYAGTYKAVSQCIVWALERSDFEAIFSGFADEAMMSAYTAALRAHGEEWLQHRYAPRPSLLQRVPLYRRFPLPPAKYLPDFSPVVKIRGERLFDQGDNPGDVYVLLEGTVVRSVRGDDGTFASGPSQLLSPTSFATFNASGRFLLLGEEPHILPGFQRYRCVVQSRVALFYRITGERFVNALLDGPNALCELREKLSQLYLHAMVLDPSCLNFAPLLRPFSSSALQRLAHDAKPAVVARAVSVCEPAQTVKEIYLVTLGEVRDPRTFGHLATTRLPTPPPSEEDTADDEESDQKGHRGRKDPKKTTDRSGAKPAAGSGAAAASAVGASGARGKARAAAGAGAAGGVTKTGARGGGGGAVAAAAAASSATYDEPDAGFTFADDVTELAVANQAALSTSKTSGTGGSLVAVCVDEQEEFNPALPKRPAKRFLTTLGGGWEGLLTDKWPNGWTTSTTTELWAIPTLSLRTEYNNAGRSVQSAILAVARQNQKTEQGLSALPPAKLPPMSSYLPEQVAVKANLASAAAAVIASGSGRRRPKLSGRSSGRPTGSGLESSLASVHERTASTGGATGLPDIYSINYVSQVSNGNNESGQRASLFNSREAGEPTVRGPTAAATTAPKPKPTRPKALPAPAKKHKDVARGTTTTTTATTDGRKSGAAPTASTALRAAPVAPSLSPEQAAAAAQARAKAHRARAMQASTTTTTSSAGDTATAHAGPAAASEPPVSTHLLAVYRGEFDEGDPALLNVVRDPVPPAPTTRARPTAAPAPVPADAWPVSSSARHARWFQEVPSYEPLPGTINNRAMAVAAPEFANNTTFMTTRHGKQYQDTLSAQEQYFSSTLPKEDRVVPSASAAPAGLASSSPQPPRGDVPKRHAVK